MERLLKKWETAKSVVPAPEVYQDKNASEYGAIFFGTSTQSALEALEGLRAEGIEIDALRVKAFPFNNTVEQFIAEHKQVFVIEQNRDAQLRQLIVNDCGVNPAQLIPVLNYDGMAITAEFIKTEIRKNHPASNVTPLRQNKAEEA